MPFAATETIWRRWARLPILAGMGEPEPVVTTPAAGSRYRVSPGWFLALLVVAALTARRAVLLGAIPSGLDGGQWLAIGRGLLGGEGRSTPGAYAPLVPLLTASLSDLLGPVDAVRLVALGSYLLVVATLGAVAGSQFGGLPGAAIAGAFGSSGAMNEPLAFGGYPQQVALAALIVAVWSSARLAWGDGEERRNLSLLAAGLGIAALAHHVYYPLALACVAAACGLGLLARSPSVRSVVLRMAAVSGISVLLAAPTLAAFLQVGYAPPLDAVDLSVAGAWRYGTREAPVLWLAIVLAGGAAVLFTPRRRRSSPWTFASAAIGVGGASFALSGEPRALSVLLLGGLCGVAVGLPLGLRPLSRVRFGNGSRLGQRLPPRAPLQDAAAARERIRNGGTPASSSRASDTTDRRGRATTGGVLALLAIALATPGDRATSAYVDFYRVLDPSLLAAAGRVEMLGRSVAIKADRRGWPVGWWLEGLTEAPVAVGSDARWLGIPAERERAAAVAALFDGALSPSEVRERAGRLGVDLLLVRKWEWIGWERWLAAPAPAVEPVFDDDVTLILRLLPEDGSAEIAGV